MKARSQGMGVFTILKTAQSPLVWNTGIWNQNQYGKFSEFQVCSCGLDSGNLTSETVRTHKRRVCL